jgi:hypothetical protein
MGTTLHEGWAVLTFVDSPPLAGRLRYEQVGSLYQWVLDVPAGHYHTGYSAIVDPLRVRSIRPCNEGTATEFARQPAPLRDADAAPVETVTPPAA